MKVEDKYMPIKKQIDDAPLVYSTESEKICSICNKIYKKCICKKAPSLPQSDGVVRLMRQTKGRKGKGVTLITAIPLDSGELKNLAKSLKQKCGSGGSIKNGIIEIQGDHRDLLETELKNLGYKVKRSGG